MYVRGKEDVREVVGKRYKGFSKVCDHSDCQKSKILSKTILIFFIIIKILIELHTKLNKKPHNLLISILLFLVSIITSIVGSLPV